MISQPNKKFDRKKQPILTDVALLANEFNIKLFQPEKVKEIYDELKSLDFDFFVTAAFGQFIPDSVLSLAKELSINVHGSLLEKYRGAAPIQHALLNDDTKTGITLIEMVNKMDAGDMLFQAELDILPTDTALDLFDKLANITIQNLPKWITNLYIKNYSRTKQNEALVTFANKIQNEDAELFSSQTAKEALNKIRAFNDQPGAFIMHNGKRLKIYRASLTKIKTPLFINFKDQPLYLIEYQFEGKKRVKHEI